MRWEELSVPEIEQLDRDRTVLILPLGSVEQHGRHMPVGTDTMLATSISPRGSRPPRRAQSRCCRRPGTASLRIICALPGPSRFRAETMMAVVEDIVASVVAHGFRRFVVLNGHGGNSAFIDVLASTLGHRFYGQARIASLTYFQLAATAIAKLRKSKPGGMGHACEFETAMMQHIRPELVKIDRAKVTYPDPGSRLSQHRSSRRLAGSRLSRFRRSLRERDIRRPLACEPRSGRSLSRRGGR